MSILGRAKLIERLRATGDNQLVVSPILSAKQIGASSIDLRMGTVALVVRARGASHVDPKYAKLAIEDRRKGLSQKDDLSRHQRHERYEFPFGSKFLLHPGVLALVPTLEWLKLPRNLHGSVTARSTWAREGLSIATANFFEPRYEGVATLELSNLGQIPIELYPGLTLAQINFTEVCGDTTRPTDNKAQFNLSFEPLPGIIAKDDDFPFIPKNSD
ncbi:MAG TPA: dCTP deaminase [Stellaceae bacterium]|jgi:dCTP deaminase|nr:dCTP deaminase [Stellaceae bacterium]